MSAKFDMVNTDRYRAACEIGTSWYKAFILKDECTGHTRSLIGYTSKMQVRATPGGTVVFEPTVNVIGSAGMVEARAGSEITEDLPAGMYYYDWIIISAPPDGSLVERVLEGKFQITDRITI